jgi:N-ethylmaleimide reductase
VTTAWDGRHVGVRLSPYWTARDRSRADRPRDGYAYTADDQTLADHDGVVTALNERPVTYLHLRGRAPRGGAPDFDAIARYRKLFDGLLIVNNGFDRETGNAIIESGIADAVSFARLFIANPDLVSRFALGHEPATQRPGHPLRGRDARVRGLPDLIDLSTNPLDPVLRRGGGAFRSAPERVASA